MTARRFTTAAVLFTAMLALGCERDETPGSWQLAYIEGHSVPFDSAGTMLRGGKLVLQESGRYTLSLDWAEDGADVSESDEGSWVRTGDSLLLRYDIGIEEKGMFSDGVLVTSWGEREMRWTR